MSDPSLFKWRYFQADIVLCAVRWCLRNALSYRDVEELLRERTLAGLASARRRGRRGGRPKAIDRETFALALQLYEARTISVQHICDRLGIARRTLYRYLVAHRAQHLKTP